MNFKIINTKQSHLWVEYLMKISEASGNIHYYPDYHRLFEINNDGTAEVFIYEDKNKIYFYPYLVRTLPLWEEYKDYKNYKDIISVFGYTGPTANNDEVDFINAADSTFKKYCLENNYLSELIRFNPLLENHNIANNINDIDIIKLKKYVYINLTLNEDELLKRYKKRLKDYISSAKQYDNISKYTSDNKEILYKFIELYQKHMTKIGASKYYLFSKSYFNKLLEIINKNGMLFYTMDNSNLIAACLFLFKENIVFYHHGCRELNHPLSGLMNKYLYHKAFLYFAEKGFKKCLLGGGVSNNDDDSLLQFKLNYSSESKYFYLGKRVHNKYIYKSICDIWELKYPELKSKYSDYIDKYHFKE